MKKTPPRVVSFTLDLMIATLLDTGTHDADLLPDSRDAFVVERVDGSKFIVSVMPLNAEAMRK